MCILSNLFFKQFVSLYLILIGKVHLNNPQHYCIEWQMYPNNGNQLLGNIEHCRVKSGNFGHQVNSDSNLVCFIL